MIIYSAALVQKRQGWRKRQIRSQFRNLLAILITTLLVLAVFNGLVKSFSVRKFLGNSNWDNRASVAVALNTKPTSVLVVQNDPKRLTFLVLGDEAYVETGKIKTPLEKLGFFTEAADGRELTKVLSLTFRANIANYLFFDRDYIANKENAGKIFKNLASLTTPFLILTEGKGPDIKDTDITRIDMFRLWWQLKDLSTDKLELVDLSGFGEEITADSQKLLGFDEEALLREISKYLDNVQIAKEGSKIKIKNVSGRQAAGYLAADFIASTGGNVVDIELVTQDTGTSTILTNDKNSYTASYLAKVFKCDIKSPVPTEAANSGEIVVVIGRDFIQRFFE